MGNDIPPVKSIVCSKNRTGIPKPIAEKLGIEPGSVLVWTETADGVKVVKMAPPKKKRRHLSDIFRDLGPIEIFPR